MPVTVIRPAYTVKLIQVVRRNGEGVPGRSLRMTPSSSFFPTPYPENSVLDFTPATTEPSPAIASAAAFVATAAVRIAPMFR